MTNYINNIQRPIRALKISLEEVVDLHENLNKKILEVLESEINPIDGLDVLTEEQKENYKKQLMDAYIILVIIQTEYGGFITLGGEAPFSSPQLKGQSIQSVKFSCKPNIGSTWLPKVGFEILFDFSKPSLFNWNTGVSDPTLNASYYQVFGTDDTFILAFKAKIEDLLKMKSTKLNWLHAANIYDVGLWIFALPLSFLICLYLEEKVTDTFSGVPSIVQNLFYVYVFITTVFLYRAVLGYTKWLWPKVECTDKSPSKIHRGIWGTILLGIIIFFITELISTFIPLTPPPQAP